jgi:hypothetical protein
MNHSLINANGHTHAKIALLAVAVSVVFMAAVAGFGGKSEFAGGAHGPVVKASTLISVAGSETSQVR